MNRYALTFCRHYVTAPTQLLSYLDWDKHRLRDRGVSVRPVHGANHFFDLAQEFELLDEVLDILDGGNHG